MCVVDLFNRGSRGRNVFIGIPLDLSKCIERGTEVERSNGKPADLGKLNLNIGTI